MSEGSSSVGIDIAAGPEAGTGDFLGGSAELEEVADAEVEENADSRFIDFSLATPWEHLVADLERAIKAWTRQRDADIEYQGGKYRFFFIESDSSRSARAVAAISSVYQMMEWFGVSSCFLLAPSQTAVASASLRRTLHSALVCAVDALRCPIPIFLVSTTVDALHRAREILGYALHAAVDAGAGAEGPRGGRGLTIHYESALLEGVAPKHPLFYLDGLMALFQSKVLEFSAHSVADGVTVAVLKESYFFRISEGDRFLTRSVTYNNDTKKLRRHPEIQSTVEDLAAAFPDRDDMSASLNKLVLTVDYGARLCGAGGNAVDDNEFYTTLHPSSLPHNCWEVQAEFLPLRNGSDLEPQGLAFCLRQLLALYIAGKCCRKEQTVATMSGRNGELPQVDRAKALSVAGVLSIRSRDAVSAVCVNSQSSTEENGGLTGAGGNIPQDLLMRVFSRSMWVDVNPPSPSREDDGFAEDSVSSSSLIDGGPAESFGVGRDQQKGKVPAECFEYANNYGITSSPWNWLVHLHGAPVGSWLNLVSVYTGSLSDFSSMCYFWSECCHQLRVHLETGVPVPRLHPPQPVSSAVSSAVEPPADGLTVGRVNIKKPATKETPSRSVQLWEESLWTDVIDDRATKGMHFCLPDTERCLIFQKLQMLQMCILCGEETVTIDLRDAHGHVQPSDSERAAVKPPQLQRRLPMTTDMNAHTQYLEGKLISGKSRTGNENPLLRWQIVFPSVVSDVRAFKAENSEATFDDFLSWYSPCSLPTDTLQDIWTFCVPALARDQHPLFKAEKEAERVLGYLESLTPVQLTAEMLCTAMISMHMVLYFDLLDTISSDGGSLEGGALHASMMADLYRSVEEAVGAIREDCPVLSDTSDSSISQHALLAVDRVCSMIQSIEETKARADSCRLQFSDQRRLRTELGMTGRATAASPEEARHLFQLAKSASRGDNHSWHRFDARELGPPDIKIFSLCLLPPAEEGSGAVIQTFKQNVLHAGDSNLNLMMKSLQGAQRMHATITGDELRASLIFSESI